MHELSITRLIAAPPERVWRAMTDRMEDWRCPRPWRAKMVANDRRAGGACSMVMSGPDGEVMPHDGIYLVWEEGRRFAMTDAVKGDLEPAGPFMIGIWEVAAEGGGTRYTASARHWTAEARDQHVAMGFETGWAAAADQLAALCEAPDADRA